MGMLEEGTKVLDDVIEIIDWVFDEDELGTTLDNGNLEEKLVLIISRWESMKPLLLLIDDMLLLLLLLFTVLVQLLFTDIVEFLEWDVFAVEFSDSTFLSSSWTEGIPRTFSISRAFFALPKDDLLEVERFAVELKLLEDDDVIKGGRPADFPDIGSLLIGFLLWEILDFIGGSDDNVSETFEVFGRAIILDLGGGRGARSFCPEIGFELWCFL